MVEPAVEAGVSCPTLYAHYGALGDVIEAVVARALHASLAAVGAAEPGVGPADEAIDRMLAASWATSPASTRWRARPPSTCPPTICAAHTRR